MTRAFAVTGSGGRTGTYAATAKSSATKPTATSPTSAGPAPTVLTALLIHFLNLHHKLCEAADASAPHGSSSTCIGPTGGTHNASTAPATSRRGNVDAQILLRHILSGGQQEIHAGFGARGSGYRICREAAGTTVVRRRSTRSRLSPRRRRQAQRRQPGSGRSSLGRFTIACGSKNNVGRLRVYRWEDVALRFGTSQHTEASDISSLFQHR